MTSGNAEELKNKVLCSVPSAVQSHKPPLAEVIEDAFEISANDLRSNIPLSDSQCLEVFGRYLLPGWATVGNQCLMLQGEHYFEEKKGKKHA